MVRYDHPIDFPAPGLLNAPGLNNNKASGFFTLSGQWLLDPNEINGWGVTGPYDPTNSQDLGNVGAANLAWTAGGVMFPFDVNLLRFRCIHRNNNAENQAWGWVLAHIAKVVGGTNAGATSYILDEVADNGGVGPRDYLATSQQLTDIDLTALPNTASVPAGNLINVAVASPTAVATNRYVQVLGGYLSWEEA